jgi:hypothetical protein
VVVYLTPGGIIKNSAFFSACKLKKFNKPFSNKTSFSHNAAAYGGLPAAQNLLNKIIWGRIPVVVKWKNSFENIRG